MVQIQKLLRGSGSINATRMNETLVHLLRQLFAHKGNCCRTRRENVGNFKS